MQQANYFFSYSRKDSDFVKRIATDLKKAGANVWLDQLDIAPGSPWDDSIQNALNGAQGLIVILSDDSVKSKNVMDEVSYAMSQGKRVVPLVLENCPIPFRLARLQYIDFKGDYDSSFENLLKTLNTPDALPDQSSTSPLNISPGMKSKKSSVKPVMIFSAGILVVALIIFAVFKNRKGTINDSPATHDTSTITRQNNITEQPPETNDQSANPGKVAEAHPQTADQKVVPNPGRINLFAPANGAQILVASNDSWKYTIDGLDNDYRSIPGGVGSEAVFGFKDDRSATFDTFTMFINETTNDNVKEFELFAGNDTPTGAFQSIGKFQTQNVKLFKSPYQEFRFQAVTAKYLKVKLLSLYADGGWPHVYEFQLFGNLK